MNFFCDLLVLFSSHSTIGICLFAKSPFILKSKVYLMKAYFEILYSHSIKIFILFYLIYEQLSKKLQLMQCCNFNILLKYFKDKKKSFNLWKIYSNKG